jgi:hypothetical protein
MRYASAISLIEHTVSRLDPVIIGSCSLVAENVAIGHCVCWFVDYVQTVRKRERKRVISVLRITQGEQTGTI